MSHESEQIKGIVEQKKSFNWLPFVPFVLFIILAIVFYFSLGREPTLEANGRVGALMPDFVLPMLEKGVQTQPITLNEMRERLPQDTPVVMNVWASWCPQCYLEHAFIEALSQAGVQVLGLNYKDKAQKAQGFLEQLSNPYALILFDEQGQLGLDLGVSGAPETYLIGTDGVILARHAGVLDRSVWDSKFATLWRDQTGEALFKGDGQ